MTTLDVVILFLAVTVVIPNIIALGIILLSTIIRSKHG